MRFDELDGRRVVIWGTGREGRAAHAELERRGVPSLFALTGAGQPPPDLADATAVGAAAMARLEDADVVIKSPGVPRTSPELRRLRERGVAVTSLTDLWLADNAHRVVAVTGTKGKSTTSSMIWHLLVSVGIRASLVGNGGVPVTDGEDRDADVAVTEVSSYQAADLATSPRVAVVTSLYPEHLPWHGSYEQYVADKLNLVRHAPEVVVLPDEGSDIARLVGERIADSTTLVTPGSVGITCTPAGISWQGVGELAAEQLPLRGRHNHLNIALALTAVVRGFDLGNDDRHRALAAIAAFPPLAHRLEVVPSQDGRRWVDDSLATAPEAVVAALEAFPDDAVTLVLGGADRGLDFAPLLDHLRGRTSAAPVRVVAIGPAGARWTDLGHRDTTLAGDFAKAMEVAQSQTPASALVLLSPGAPSFDEFRSFEERSAAFRAAAAAAPAPGQGH